VLNSVFLSVFISSFKAGRV